MTEKLFLKLEEKVIALLSEIENLRKERERIVQENLSLKVERENNANRLQELIKLFDAVATDVVSNVNIVATKPVLLQGGLQE